METNSCVQCGVTILDVPTDSDGYFVLNHITPDGDVDYNICSPECLAAFVEESVNVDQ